jgi:hypothetical protein
LDDEAFSIRTAVAALHNRLRDLVRASFDTQADTLNVADAIDGTGGLMYAKRSAWILTGVAPRTDSGSAPVLSDIDIAVQTEIPPPKQELADTLWAVRGQGTSGSRVDLCSGESVQIDSWPS